MAEEIKSLDELNAVAEGTEPAVVVEEGLHHRLAKLARSEERIHDAEDRTERMLELLRASETILGLHGGGSRHQSIDGPR